MLSGCCLYAVAVLTGAGNSVLSRFCCVQVHKVKTRCKHAGVNDDSGHSARTSRNARSTIRQISFAEWLPAGGWAIKAATVSGESGVSGRSPVRGGMFIEQARCGFSSPVGQHGHLLAFGPGSKLKN